MGKYSSLIFYFVALGVCFFEIDFAYSDILARGPYLQRVSPTEAIIRWRSASVTDSVVFFGTSEAALASRVEDSALTLEHRVTVTGLNPSTKYFYSVGSSSERLTPNDGTYFFSTSPIGSKDTRIWVLGDSGRGNIDAYSVKEGYLNFIKNDGRKADLWLMLGDNAYFYGLDVEYQNGLFNVYPEILRNTTLWPTLGNHDGSAKGFVVGEIPYYATFSLPRNGEVGGVASGTESYYSFDYGDIHFICLNSYDEDRSTGGLMAKWLESDLRANMKKWTIAFWHHPPYSKGTHDSDTEVELIEMREKMLPILEGGGVDLVLAGHSHNYERSFLVDGHYGLSSSFDVGTVMKLDGSSGETGYLKPPETVPHRGAVYVVNGTGSAVGGGSLNHPVFFTTKSQLGSMILDVSAERLQAKFVSSNGNTEDYFEISRSISLANLSKRKIIAGSGSGKSATLNTSDSKGMKFTSVINKKTGKYSFRADFQFSLPSVFYRRILKLRAGRRSVSTPNLIVSVSIDGKNFKKVATLSALTRNSSDLKIPIEGSGVGDVVVRLEIMPTRKQQGPRDGADLDFLAISNG